MSDNTRLLQDLCNLEIPNTIKISPDSQKVLYSTQLYWGHTAGSRGVSTIWLASVGEANSSRKLVSGTFKDYAPAWHPDGASIAFISDRAKPGERWAIYSMRMEGDFDPEAITPTDNTKPIEMFAFSPDGQSIAFLSSDEKTADQKAREEEEGDAQVWGRDWPYTRLRVMHLQSKRTQTLDLDRHVFAFTWSSDGRRLCIASSSTSDPEARVLTGSLISVVDTDLSAAQDLCHFPRDISNLQWANDGKLYFNAGVPAGSTFRGQGVYTVDVDSPSPRYETVGFGVDDDDAIGLTQANGEPIIKLEHRLEARIALLDREVLYSKQEELEAFDVASLTNTDDYILAIASSNVNQPVEVFTKATNSDEFVQLSNHGLAFKSREFGRCSSLPFQSSDGKVEIDSIYLTPAAHANKGTGNVPSNPLPTVVLIHGGPRTRVTNAFNTFYYYFTPCLLSLGYGVLMPNYRGSSGRGDRFASWAIDGAGIYEYEDVIAATQNAIERGYADANRLIVGGWSHGGYLSLLSSVRNGSHGHEWRFKAAIAGASISDVDSMALTSDQANTYQPPLNGGRVIWNVTSEDTRNRKASPLWLFHDTMVRSKQTGETIIPPLLFLHGVNDDRCPISQALGMRRALESGGLPFEFVSYPRQGHIFGEQKFWIDLGIRVARWCQKYIGEGGI